MFLNKIRNSFCVCNKCCARGQTGKHLCRQQSVRNNVSSFASTFTSLSDWFKVLAPLFQPTRSKTKTNRGLHVHIFPRFVSATYNYFEFSLVYWIVYVLFHWPKSLLWFRWKLALEWGPNTWRLNTYNRRKAKESKFVQISSIILMIITVVVPFHLNKKKN